MVVLQIDGKCAQACRLPYTLLQNGKAIDKGYLLSPRDLCGLEFIPSLIEAGVRSFKIEGRLKSPEYVGIVTRIYRKYIDLYFSGEEFVIDEKDLADLRQVYNRGGFSKGHLDVLPNKDLIFKEKPNNMGIYIGNVSNYNEQNSHITLNLNDAIAIGDSITFENEPTKYTISELMFQGKNIPFACDNELITIGRMKGNIKPGDKIYKIANKRLFDDVRLTFSGKEFKKIKLNAKISIKKNSPISVSIVPEKEYEMYEDISINIKSNIIPENAKTQPITKERIITQFSKTNDTPYVFSKIDVDLDDNLYIPKISELNELRRNAIQSIQDLVVRKYTRVAVNVKPKVFKNRTSSDTKISLLLNNINLDYDYTKMEHVDRIYIPLHVFYDNKNKEILHKINSRFAMYIYLPTIINLNYRNLFDNLIDSIIEEYNIAGFVLSNIGELDIIRNKKIHKDFDFIANYSLNVFNDYTINELAQGKISTVTLSPELNKTDIQNIKSGINKELIVYGKAKVMMTKYCFLGCSNNCYPTCDSKCMDNKNYYLQDRMGFLFQIVPNNLQTITNIYNSKILSIEYKDLQIDYARIDILDEDIDMINEIIRTVKSGKRFEGSDYTNGNINRNV